MKLLNTRKAENRVHMTTGRMPEIYKHFRSTVNKIGVFAIVY